ncbi:MAG TPA: ABC transporter permease [Cyclobacteriaceae bacterium]|nr:ABC transporter permease [Cyclobacteriaceae bacterium]
MKEKFVRKLLALIPSHLREEIEGDLVQRFHKDVDRFGVRRAQKKFILSVIRFLRPGILLRRNSNKKYYPVFMFRNYFVIAFRNLAAHKMNSGINMLSLIIGITSALIMMSVIRYEVSFDSFHSNAKRIYRITRHHKAEGGLGGPGVASPLADAFRNEVTAIEKITGVQYYGGAQVDVELNGDVKKFKEPYGTAFVDSEFFNVFDFNGTGFKWISGNPAKAFTESNSVVLTESMAKKYFNNEDPLGRSLRLEAQLDVKVTGVITDLPANSDFPFTFLVSYPTLHQIEPDRMKDDWLSINANHQAFVVLPENVTIEQAAEQFHKAHALHVDKAVADELRYFLQPLSDIHKNAALGNFNRRTVDETALLIMALTGILLLSVGCINYVNIATAQSTLRGKEIGVRKALGGQRKQLILQFLSETFALVLTACVVSLFVADIVLMSLSGLTNMIMIRHLFMDPFVLTALGTLVLVITVIAGFYPAIVVSAYGITNALKGLTGNRVSSAFLRKSLVVVQFAVTQAFLIGAFIVINQLQYSRTMDMGFDKDLVINIPIPEQKSRKDDDLKNMVLNNPHVSAVSLSSSYPSGDRRNLWFVGVGTKEMQVQPIVEYQSVDTGFFGLYGITFAAGRNFLNSDSISSAIVNEELSTVLGYKAPEEAIGHTIGVDGKDYTIVGVTNNFHNSSVKKNIGSMIFVFKPSFFLTSSIKINDPSSIQQAIVDLEKIWSVTYPSMVFQYTFFDENIDNYYKGEKKLSALLQGFSAIFLLLACLGLYGLLSFVVNRRMKEVAVRKVFGAGIGHIVTLISKDYVVLILISFVIAAPVSYYFMNQWLENYTFHIPITFWILIVPGLVALAIAMITLSGKLLRAASRNPAETLKYE